MRIVVTKLDEAGRREAIHRWLERLGRASVSDLATQFGVSSVTIRKDLSELELRGLLTRVHGGATRTSLKDEGSFPFRLQDQAEQKRDIARRAARLVHSGDRIALDSSTTAHHLAHELLELRDLFVLTYSIPTATLFLDSSSAFVFLLGGPMRRSSRACAVTPMSSCFGGQVDLFFFSARERPQPKASRRCPPPKPRPNERWRSRADATSPCWIPRSSRPTRTTRGCRPAASPGSSPIAASARP